MSSVQIENFLRAVAGVDSTGATTFEWWGSGVTDIQRTGVGVFVITLVDEIDPTQAIASVTPKGSGGQGSGSLYSTVEINASNCVVRIWDSNQAAADPGAPQANGFSFALNVSDIETEWVPTI